MPLGEGLAKLNPLRKTSAPPLELLSQLEAAAVSSTVSRPMLIRFAVPSSDWERFGTQTEAMAWLQKVVSSRRNIEQLYRVHYPGSAAADIDGYLREWTGREEDALSRLRGQIQASTPAPARRDSTGTTAAGAIAGPSPRLLLGGGTKHIKYAYCSWCLVLGNHARKKQNMIGRDQFQCANSQCGKLTAPVRIYLANFTGSPSLSQYIVLYGRVLSDRVYADNFTV